jgi:hypothetical protein
LCAGDRDDVQRVVELAVPAAVEAMLGALPGGARDRRGPGLQPEARVGPEPFVAGGVADQDGGGHRPAALLGQQLGAVRADQFGQVGRELIDLRVESAQLRDVLARDPHARAGGQLAQLPVDAVKHPRLWGEPFGLPGTYLGASTRSGRCRIPRAATGYPEQIGYLSNFIPVPGGIGVLDGSLIGMLVLYGLGATVATAATLAYHAISLWVPAIWGTIAFIVLQKTKKQPIVLCNPTEQLRAGSG